MSTLDGPFLQCQACGRKFALSALIWKCPCGGVLDVKGTAMFPKEQLPNRPMNFWRYREALAMPDAETRVSLGEVMTPILKSRFRNWEVSFKLEYVLPTGSYKDRGIAVCFNQLSAMGVRRICEDSSGNAGASTAAYAAAAGIRAEVYVPDRTSPAKVNQISIYGARCHEVPGRSEAAQRAQNASGDSYYIGHTWNPFFACGNKSAAYEIAEQSLWCPPDWIVTPVGAGGLLMGLIEGFAELQAVGYISKLPRILAVQSASCCPIYQAWVKNEQEVHVVETRDTYAEGVATANPARGTQVLQAIRQYNGAMVAVEDTELLSCWKEMAKMGIFMEPTSAIAVAGAWLAKESRGWIKAEETSLIMITGHGLKSKSTLLSEVS